MSKKLKPEKLKKSYEFHVSRSEIAYLFGVTPQNTMRWDLKPIKSSGRGTLYDLREVVISRTAKDRPSTTADLKNRLITLQAEKKQFDLEKDKKLWVLVLEVEKAMEQLTVTVQTQMRGLPSKLAPQLEGVKTREAFRILTKGIHDILEQAANNGARKIKATKKTKR